MTARFRFAFALPLAALLACQSADGRRSTDSTATAAASADTTGTDSTARRIAQNGDLKHPESAAYDPDLHVWFVSNINGDPSAHDGNGFISRLTSDIATDSLKFIESGRNGARLDAPKGLAIQGDTLWVADINVIRAFNKRTGRPVATVSAAGARFLNDVAVGPDGAVYVTDTGGDRGPYRIYRVGADHRAAVAIEDTTLAGPNGIAWDSRRQLFVVATMGSRKILSWDPAQKAVSTIGTGAGMQDGIGVLPDGRVVASSWNDSTLFLPADSTARPLIPGVPSPADFGIDSAGRRIAIPLLMENRVELWQLP
ncbi:MAG TPA: SMP-30/gluconolactonase/LRE family protein [Gemmatimonadales bacterium]|jgi:sugar lactone lactonase YvrE|nr:SMP-30/gluconolactonase/LRE family protein [Gemmatimonadales bacterium]